MSSDQKHHPESLTTSHSKNIQLYVISISKLIIMASLSMGLYLYYWNYRHWLLIRGQHGLRLIPLLCTIFGAFTIFFLMKKIVDRCHQTNRPIEGTALGVTLMYCIPPLLLMLWEFSLTESILANMPLSILIMAPIMLMLIYITFFVVAVIQVQQAVNVFEGDACGLKNSQITWTNVIWLIACWMPMAALFGFLSAYAPFTE
ncbi:hypothetical protein IAE39_002973 [Pseudomonas sp. S37]|uniref:hypothetical protein n=1 Tax=Pseudomonas sp. S37 TaxID=2767449 RepID=UPI001F38063B|nr:hypothetical protein [Pseudomonas sp. S37]MBK4994799.1 hypothetical protein [Pseudomonas sp. S37]